MKLGSGSNVGLDEQISAVEQAQAIARGRDAVLEGEFLPKPAAWSTRDRPRGGPLEFVDGVAFVHAQRPTFERAEAPYDQASRRGTDWIGAGYARDEPDQRRVVHVCACSPTSRVAG